MASITDPQALAVLRDQIRPLCEEARAFKARVTALQTPWYGGVSGLFPNDSSPVVDGRAADGVSQLTGADVTNAIVSLFAAHDAITDATVGKPCVRPLNVTAS